ncbi:hypothetical protein L915_19444, partial [Phytophthora nicotianae]
MLKEKVSSAIREKWPGWKRQLYAYKMTMLIYGEVVAAGLEQGWKVKMVCQPHRSPDCNILDLAIFYAIQSIQYRQPTNQIDELIKT